MAVMKVRGLTIWLRKPLVKYFALQRPLPGMFPGRNIGDICKDLTSSNGFPYKIKNSLPFPPQINVAWSPKTYSNN